MKTNSRRTEEKSVRVSGPLSSRQPYSSATDVPFDSNALLILPTPLGAIAVDLATFGAAYEAATHLQFPIPSAGLSENHASTLVDAERIARLFDMEPSWFLTRAREDRIPHVRLGKYVRFDPAEIRDFFRRDTDRHANS